MDEGKKDEYKKIIQHPTNSIENDVEPEEPENGTVNEDQTIQKPDKNHKNTILFPSTPEKSNDTNIPESAHQSDEETETQSYGRGC